MQVTAGSSRDNVRAMPYRISFATNDKDLFTGLRWKVEGSKSILVLSMKLKKGSFDSGSPVPRGMASMLVTFPSLYQDARVRGTLPIMAGKVGGIYSSGTVWLRPQLQQTRR